MIVYSHFGNSELSMINWYFFFVIVLLVGESSGDFSQSLTHLSSNGNEYLPVNMSAQSVSNITLKSVRECVDACHDTIQCRVFDYGAVANEECRLFEGDIEGSGSIVPSSTSDSIVGVIQITPSLYTEYGQSCSSMCVESRYLKCSMNSICECPEYTYWDPLLLICLVQLPQRGAPCEQNLNMCREDLNYTCLQFEQCGRKLFSLRKLLMSVKMIFFNC